MKNCGAFFCEVSGTKARLRGSLTGLTPDRLSLIGSEHNVQVVVDVFLLTKYRRLRVLQFLPLELLALLLLHGSLSKTLRHIWSRL